MALFERVKAAVSVPEAALRYGLPYGRGSMARCPFHPDRTPSLRLYDDHYYCFGCHAHGDVISLTAALLGLTPVQAARRLAEDFDDAVLSDAPIAPVPARSAARLTDEALLCQRALNTYARLLGRWKRDFAPKSADETPDPRWVEAMQMYDRMNRLTEDLACLSPPQLDRAVRRLTEGGKIAWLCKRLAAITSSDTPV